MLSEVPEGWSELPFGELTSIVGGTTPKKNVEEYWDSEDVLWATPTDITSLPEASHFLSDTATKASVRAVERGGLKLLPANTVLMTSRATIGYVAIAKSEMSTNQGFANFLPSEKYVPLFLLYLLQSKKEQFVSSAGGSTFKEISKGVLKSLSALLPPLNEQHRIAEILASVDASIQATQAVIEQAERVKRGLMEELLTGGLGSEAIERGEVPEGWQRTKQGSVATFFNGRAYKLKEWEKEGTPVIRLQNLTGSGKEYYYSTLELPPHQYCDFGDLLFMWSASFGAYIWQGGKAIYHYHIWKVEQDAAQLMRLFHYYLLQYYTDIWKQDAHGMAMLHLTKKGMEQLEITIPPLSQQKKIVQILSDADDFIAQQRANAEQQMKIKQGLMDELLTGKVRTV